MVPSPRYNAVQPVVIIGAGLSGLALAHELKTLGVRSMLLEQERNVAEPWRRRYSKLQLNTHRHYSHLPDRPLPRGTRAFAKRDTVIRYLEDYAGCFGDRIRYGEQVQRLDPADGVWRIRTGTGEWRTRHVVIATGRERMPRLPQWPGAEGFTGELIHAADFTDAERYRGRRVLVVGAGNSGVDILNQLVRVPTRDLRVSVRHGPLILPIRFIGMPVQRMSGLMSRLPSGWIDATLRMTEWLAFGNLRRQGLPRDSRPATRRLAQEGVAPAFDDGFVKALKQRRVLVEPIVRGFDGAEIILLDGRRIQMDAVICATGYRPGLEAMLGHLDVLSENGIPLSHAATALPGFPGLWFLGMRPRLEGNFYAACVDSQQLAARIGRELQAENPFTEP